MKKFFRFGMIALIFLGLVKVSVLHAQEGARANNEVKSVVLEYLKERMISSGTLDLYDEKIEKVRNLRTLKVYDDVAKVGDVYTLHVDYRDITNGDIVDIAINVADVEGELTVKDILIGGIKEPKAKTEEADVKTEFTDSEIQDVMKSYLGSQAKFTGSIMLFDKDNEKMRTLELITLSEEVRRLGKYYISRAEFKDLDNGETIGIDITIENNKNGGLDVQSLRIREVRKGQ